MIAMKRVFGRIRQMSTPARTVLSFGMMLVCILLLGAAAFLFAADGFSAVTYQFYNYSQTLMDHAAAIALVAVVTSALLEERFSQ